MLAGRHVVYYRVAESGGIVALRLLHSSRDAAGLF